MPRENKRKKPSLTVQITISLLIGIVAGIAMQSIPDIAEGYVKPFGTIYLNLIKMIVVPVVVLSIIQGIVSLQDVRKVGSIGIKTIAFYLVTTAIAVTLGLVAANLLQVGAGYTLGTEALTYEPAEPLNLMDTLVNIFPSNAFQPLADATMLQVIVIALFFGFGIIAVAGFMLVRSKVVSPQKLMQEEIEREDERNIAISRAAGLAGFFAGVGLFAVLAFVFMGLGYRVPSFVCVGGIYVLVAGYLVARRVYAKKM